MENVTSMEIISLVKQYDSCWLEHNNPDQKSEPAEHNKRNIEYAFICDILCPTPPQKYFRKNFEQRFLYYMNQDF